VVIDIALGAFFVGAFLLGMLRGAVRQLMAFGAWLVTFVVAAYVRDPLGNWYLGQQPQLSVHYAHMVAFLASFVVLFAVAVLVIEVTGANVHLIRALWGERLLGGLLALGVAVLAVASAMITLDSYYAVSQPVGEAELGPVRALVDALQVSAVSHSLHGSFIRGLITLLGPLLPGDVHVLAG
jgi:uncharacterized membrane protein required for colicin V production